MARHLEDPFLRWVQSCLGVGMCFCIVLVYGELAEVTSGTYVQQADEGEGERQRPASPHWVSAARGAAAACAGACRCKCTVSRREARTLHRTAQSTPHTDPRHRTDHYVLKARSDATVSQASSLRPITM